MNENTNNYELSFWLSPELDEKKVEVKFNNLLKQLEKLGAAVSISQLPQLKPLAYPIKKGKNLNLNGYFGFVQFISTKDLITSLEKNLKFDEEVIRFFIIARKEAKQKIKIPSTVFKKSLFKNRSLRGRAEERSEQEKKPEKELSLEELDKKLNEILQDKTK
ncbi:MAG: 30S ribosomal protein S6 [Candidatus Paceibacterota bacterium]|jgi:ribosomal protein S6